MKNVLFFLFFLLGLCAPSVACDITLTLDAPQKASYKAGDEVVVTVQVKHSHRVCRLPINETTYEPDGVTILAATDWKEISAGVFTRKMKLRVVGNASGNLVFGVRRKCTRDNSVGTLRLAGIPSKQGS